MKPRPLMLLAMAMLPCVSMAAAPTPPPSTPPVATSKAVEQGGLSVTLSAPTAAIPADAQPRLVVEFKNVSADYINLYDVEAVWTWRILLTNADQQVVDSGPWRVRFDTLANRSHPIAHRQVKPGESTQVIIDLNDPPFTFNYVFEGIEKHLVPPARFLTPGTYRAEVKVELQNPFGAGHHEWTGPLTSQTVELTIGKSRAKEPTKEEIAGYDKAIDQVTEKLPPGGFWLNGGFPEIKLPADAKPEDVVAAAVNTHQLGSKAYRILRVRKLDRSDGMSAAMVKVGAQMKVVVFFPFQHSKESWWSRFYDADLRLPGAPQGDAPKP